MITRGFAQLLAEASAVIESVSPQEAQELHRQGEVVFVDVRETHERAQGFIPGSIHASRGFLEMIADPASPAHQPAFSSGQTLVLYCAAGGRSALAAKTLKDMGHGKVVNMTGGFQGWVQTAGPVES